MNRESPSLAQARLLRDLKLGWGSPMSIQPIIPARQKRTARPASGWRCRFGLSAFCSRDRWHRATEPIFGLRRALPRWSNVSLVCAITRDHIGRLMHSQGWTPQKPERRALERNEEEIERWKQEEWPRIKKRCKAGCPYRLCRRIGLPADSQCGQDLGSARTDSHPSSPPGTARQNLRHFWNFRKPQPTSLLFALL